MTDPGDDGLELLRALLERVEQRAHAARPQHKPTRYYIRRNAHRTLAHFAANGHNRCTS
jgi:hypothetical protein